MLFVLFVQTKNNYNSLKQKITHYLYKNENIGP